MVCGVGTEVIAGEGLILTAGGFDSHIHFTCPQLAEEAIASGLTTMVGGGTGKSSASLLFLNLFRDCSFRENILKSIINLLKINVTLS